MGRCTRLLPIILSVICGNSNTSQHHMRFNGQVKHSPFCHVLVKNVVCGPSVHVDDAKLQTKSRRQRLDLGHRGILRTPDFPAFPTDPLYQRI
ncbi:hypothetical protein DFH09DRAFT_1128720, partial [Mycena vulgaris]